MLEYKEINGRKKTLRSKKMEENGNKKQKLQNIDN